MHIRHHDRQHPSVLLPTRSNSRLRRLRPDIGQRSLNQEPRIMMKQRIGGWTRLRLVQVVEETAFWNVKVAQNRGGTARRIKCVTEANGEVPDCKGYNSGNVCISAEWEFIIQDDRGKVVQRECVEELHNCLARTPLKNKNPESRAIGWKERGFEILHADSSCEI